MGPIEKKFFFSFPDRSKGQKNLYFFLICVFCLDPPIRPTPILTTVGSLRGCGAIFRLIISGVKYGRSSLKFTQKSLFSMFQILVFSLWLVIFIFHHRSWSTPCIGPECWEPGSPKFKAPVNKIRSWLTFQNLVAAVAPLPGGFQPYIGRIHSHGKIFTRKMTQFFKY